LLRKRRKNLGVHFFLPHPVEYPLLVVLNDNSSDVLLIT